jgi:ATP-dependent Clp protease ATP-binding subunit ClpA
VFERFTGDARQVVKRAHEEATSLGSPTIEAEHLLIALADPASGPPADVLAEAGLDRGRLVAALDEEIAYSLEAIGLAGDHLIEQAPRPGPRRPRGWGQSAKLALQRTVEVAGERKERRLLAGHILLAVLAAEAGTVPRVLRLAGVEPAELAGRMAAALAR